MYIKQGAFVLKKNNMLWLVAVFAGVCSCCITLYTTTMLPQDIKFSEYKKAFSKIQHPTNAKFIATYNFLGIQDFTRAMYPDTFSQGCDYQVGEVRESWDTQENIRAFYASKSIMIDGDDTSIDVDFIPLDSTGLIDTDGALEMLGGEYLFGLRDRQIFGFLKLDPLAVYYFVSVRGYSSSNLDFRCRHLIN